MTITTLSSTDFGQDATRAKQASKKGPVFITEHGKPAYVLLTIDMYLRIMGSPRKIGDILAMPGAEDIEFDPSRIDIENRPADLS